ncbi:MAG: hypothetical protein AB9903_27070 [Vulcanimicrobiota bacterium]
MSKEDAMGLQEKRRIKMLQDEVLPSVRDEIKALSGADIEWEVDWESLAHSMEALDNIEYQGIRRVLDALRKICYDDIGKEAVLAGLRKIVIKNHDSAGEKRVVFNDAILAVDGAWGAGWDGYPAEDEIKKLLEEGL